MAHRVLFLSWGRASGGREALALDLYYELVALLSELEGADVLERFEIVMLEPNACLEGFVLVHGSGRQIAAVRQDPRFRELLTAAGLVTRDLRACAGSTGEGIADVLPLYEEAVDRVAAV